MHDKHLQPEARLEVLDILCHQVRPDAYRGVCGKFHVLVEEEDGAWRLALTYVDGAHCKLVARVEGARNPIHAVRRLYRDLDADTVAAIIKLVRGAS